MSWAKAKEVRGHYYSDYKSANMRKRLWDAIHLQENLCWHCGGEMAPPNRPSRAPGRWSATADHDPPKVFFRLYTDLKPEYQIRASHSICNSRAAVRIATLAETLRWARKHYGVST